VHRFFKYFTGITTVAVFGAATALGPVELARAQDAQAQQGQAKQGQAPKKQVKDKAEYDLFNAIAKPDLDPNKRLALLNTWKEKYPGTDFKEERLIYYLTTYQALQQPAKVMETAKELLALDPKNIQALYFLTILTPQMANTSPEALDTGEKAAQGLLSAEKPANTKDEDWAKAKSDFDALAHKSLGWVAMQRKNNEQAEEAFVKSLKIKPNDAEVSYWLGTVVFAQKKPERQSEVLFHFARAAALDPKEGGLNPQFRQQVDTYLTKAYNTFHGQDRTGLTELKTTARSQPFPPEGFKIKTATEIAIEKEEEFKRTNPQLALWMGVKKELTGPNGEKYFETGVKGSAFPKQKGILIEAKPAVRPRELVLGVADPTVPEVTLKLDSPLTGKPELGSEIEFEGIPQTFTQDPFMVTFDVEKEKITGLKMEAPARRPTGKKAGGRKKS
jgi:tetratricopeptide (TPR) repeat protein